MTGFCKKNSCNESVLLLPSQVDVPIEYDNFVLLMGYTIDSELTEYHITEGIEYTIYGILIYMNQVRFLIQDDDGLPVFCPAALFCIGNTNVHWDWELASIPIGNELLFIVGYPAMEKSYSNLIDLAARKDYAIKNFLKYKDYYESNNLF